MNLLGITLAIALVMFILLNAAIYLNKARKKSPLEKIAKGNVLSRKAAMAFTLILLVGIVSALIANGDAVNSVGSTIASFADLIDEKPVALGCPEIEKFYGGKCLGELSGEEKKSAEKCLEVREKALELNVNWKVACSNPKEKVEQVYKRQPSGTELALLLNMFSFYQQTSFDVQEKTLVVAWDLPADLSPSEISPELLYYPNDSAVPKISESQASKECSNDSQCTFKFSGLEDGTFFAITGGDLDEPIYFDGRSQIGIKKIEPEKENTLVFRSGAGAERLSITANFGPQDFPVLDEYLVVAYDESYPEINFLITTTNQNLKLEGPAKITIINAENEVTVEVDTINNIKINSNGAIQ